MVTGDKHTTADEVGHGIDVLSTNTETGAIVGPRSDDSEVRPRLARHQISLADGHQVGVAVCGRGVPIVLIHGFTAEGMLYAQTLSRIVAAGFKVVAIDTANHGSTQGLPTGGADFEAYSRLVGRVIAVGHEAFAIQVEVTVRLATPK